MSSWYQVRGFFRLDLLDLLRFWPISLFSIGLTAFYYSMLGNFVPPQNRAPATVGFMVLSVLALSMFQFGSRGSVERIDPWNAFVRTLPAPLWARFVARLLLVLLIAAFAVMILTSVAVVRFGLPYDKNTVVMIGVAVPVAALVFAPIGACVGGLLHPRVTPVVVTMISLGTGWSAGLWSGGRQPAVLNAIDPILPLSAILRLAAATAAWEPAAMAGAGAVAAGWTTLGLLVAGYIHARDEGEKFR